MSIAEDLAELLGTVQRPGDFATSGTIELLAPSLAVDGVGPVALPLLPVQATQLVAVAEQAPYGRGEATLLDTSVRRTWQIAPEHVHVSGRHWARTLETIVARAADGLGVSDPIEAEFYKLLIYDEGSFFVGHRDTEKSAGMFATLVIVLPSISTGGELLVRHKDRELRLALRCDDPSEAAFAAFYADCVHEVLPVTTGCRLTLVYNLLRRGRGAMPKPPSYEGERRRLVAMLRGWRDGTDQPQTPTAEDDDVAAGIGEKLVYPLEHAYTQAELGFQTLKGADAAVASLAAAAAPVAGCTLHLALLTVHESGSAEYSGSYRRRGSSDDDDDEFEAGDVEDRSVTLSDWSPVDGSASPLGPLPVLIDEVVPPDALEDMDPDEQHFEEATGNAGATFERTYRRAALVLWPSDRIFAVLSQAGLSVTLPYLHDLVTRWEESGGDHGSKLRRDARDLAGHMIAQWPTHPGYPWQGPTESDAAGMLRLLTRLNDPADIEAMLTRVAAGGRFGREDVDAMVGALALLPPRQAVRMIERIVTATVAASRFACAGLLMRVAAIGPGTDLRDAAIRLVHGLPGDPTHAAPFDPWQRGSGVDARLVAELLIALGAIDATLADRALDHMLAWPKTYDLDEILVPAARLLVRNGGATGKAVGRLNAVCLTHLRARIAEPLAPPPDWKRSHKLTCKCPRCAEFSAFLADPGRKTWVLRAAEAERGHVEATIRKDRCDVDAQTERRGRPYSLVCTKNQASYERRVEQRKRDLADSATLGG